MQVDRPRDGVFWTCIAQSGKIDIFTSQNIVIAGLQPKINDVRMKTKKIGFAACA